VQRRRSYYWHKDTYCDRGCGKHGEHLPVNSLQDTTDVSQVGFQLDTAIFHHGPIAVYMSSVPSSSTVNDYDGSGPWFKIDELNPIFSPGSMTWPADDMLQYSVEIPQETRRLPKSSLCRKIHSDEIP
jgi:hypothetical protein